METTKAWGDRGAVFDLMQVVALSDKPTAALKLEAVLRNSGVVNLTSVGTLEALQQHIRNEPVDVVVGEISGDCCNGLAIPEILRKAESEKLYRPHLLWIGESSSGHINSDCGEFSAAPTGNKRNRAKTVGGVPLMVLRQYAKLLRTAGIQVAICGDEEALDLTAALTLLFKAKRTPMEPSASSKFISPTEDEVVEALATGEGLRVFFQPQYKLSTREIVGAEAIVRWRNSRCGEVAPALLFEMAEC